MNPEIRRNILSNPSIRTSLIKLSNNFFAGPFTIREAFDLLYPDSQISRLDPDHERKRHKLRDDLETFKTNFNSWKSLGLIAEHATRRENYVLTLQAAQLLDSLEDN